MEGAAFPADIDGARTIQLLATAYSLIFLQFDRAPGQSLAWVTGVKWQSQSDRLFRVGQQRVQGVFFTGVPAPFTLAVH